MLIPMAAGAAPALLTLAGVVAGFVDSIAGGGGLITLPSLTLALGAGVDAIGTNKICGVAAAAVALAVYVRRGHMDWRNSTVFAIAVGLGGFFGSRLAPLLPPWMFPWLLALTCPVILYIVWKRDLWVAREATHGEEGTARAGRLLDPAVVLTGLAAGIYDGAWGPGSGTFMFLALLFVARLPLLPSLAAAKLANLASGATSLVSYAMSGHVHYRAGSFVALGTLAGGWAGAHLATTRAARIVRPVLVIVVVLLLVKLIADALQS